LDAFGYITAPVKPTQDEIEHEYERRGWIKQTNNKWTMNRIIRNRRELRIHNINRMATSTQKHKLGSIMLQQKSGEYGLYLISRKSNSSEYNLKGVGNAIIISSNIDWSTRKLVYNSTIVDAWPINPSISSSSQGASKIPSAPSSGGGASKMPSSPSASVISGAARAAMVGSMVGASKTPSSPSAALPSNIWEYRDNDKIYKPYDDNACATINDQVQNKNYGQFAKKFTVRSDTHTFDVILINENEGKQSGTLNTRHIRRRGVLKQQSTTSVSPSASMSPSASSPRSYSGNAVQDFQTKPWTNPSQNPDNLTRAEWFAATCLKNGTPGSWEWSLPYEMTQNSPPGFSDDDKRKLGEDPIDLWEYRGLNAMDHRSNGRGRDLDFIGFFRFTDNRCGRGPNDLVNHTLQNVKRLRSTYGDIKMNVLYHATNKITMATKILPDKFRGAFSTTAVYGKGTYFAMGPYIDYTFGNNIYKNTYASWGGNNVDGYAYIVVSHAVTRPSLRTDNGAMNNGFAGNDSRRYITGGSLGDVRRNPLPLANREIVYGDVYDRDDPSRGCPVDDLIFVVGVAVFKL